MAIKTSASNDFLSTLVVSINVFNCRLSCVRNPAMDATFLGVGVLEWISAST